MGTICSETGMQQGDPLGPLLRCLVLQKVVSAITVLLTVCVPSYFFHEWNLDNDVIAGPLLAVQKAFTINQNWDHHWASLSSQQNVSCLA